MALASISKYKHKAKLAYRDLVQASARGEEVDPDSVETTLLLASKSWDDLESNVTALEAAIADEDALIAKDYATSIQRHKDMLTKAAEMRKEIAPLQKQVEDALKEIHDLEQRGQHHNNLRQAMDGEQRALIHRRKQTLGTMDLEAFPSID